MGRPQTQIESTGGVPREVRVAAVNCLLKNKARAANTKAGRAHTADIAGTVLDGNGGILHRFERDVKLREELYTEGVRNVFRAVNEESFRADLAGGVMSAIASPFIIATESLHGNTVIDGPTTLKVMQLLYPGAEVVPHPFGGTSLNGLSVPDFLVVSKSGLIVKVGEYKGSLREKEEGSLETQLTWERDCFQDFPELTKQGGPDLLVVTPSMHRDSIPPYVENDSKIHHMMLSFNGGKLHDIIVDLFHRYRPEVNRGGYKQVSKKRRIPEEVDEIDQYGPTLAELWQERSGIDARRTVTLVDLSPDTVPPVSDIVELARAGLIFDPGAILKERAALFPVKTRRRSGRRRHPQRTNLAA